MTRPDGRVSYLKTRPAGAELPLRSEAARMRWARAAGLPVPQVIAACQAGGADWLLTAAIPGADATRSELRADPHVLVPLLAAGLRAFHGTWPGDCPFRFGPAQALARATERVRAGLVRPEDLNSDFAHLTPAGALAELTRLGPARLAAADPVVCHGDYCLPNVLISAGQITGFIDLGRLAVADR
jgi:aminoglycoside 3'-phosphotransferase-2